MAVLRVESVVRGYHRYKDAWLPQIGDSFDLTMEEDNRHDWYAVATIKKIWLTLPGQDISEQQNYRTRAPDD